MKISLSTLAVLVVGFFLSLAVAGCEVHHTDTTHQNLLGGTTHESTTTVDKP